MLQPEPTTAGQDFNGSTASSISPFEKYYSAFRQDRFARPRGGLKVSRVLMNAATDPDGNPSETLLKAKPERLDHWRTGPELAGII